MSQGKSGGWGTQVAFAGVVVVAVAAGALAVAHATAVPSRTTGSGTPTASSNPSASASASPSSSSSSTTLAVTPCAGKTFGPPLAPLNPPSNIHVYPAAPSMEISTSKLYEATIVTPLGTMVECLDPSLAPHTVNNFVVLARNGFYNGLVFHRVVAGFVIQGGDPTGTGSGGPGYKFNDEPVKGSYTLGTLAMANSGPNTNGSQFFICIADDTSALAPSYNLFGHMVSGISVAQKVTVGTKMTKVYVTEES